jgi:quaternary ammonium compound-resistance protein SugE
MRIRPVQSDTEHYPIESYQNSTEFAIVALWSGEFAMAWFILLTEGFTRLLPSIVTLAFMGASIGCLGLAIRSIPMGTAYAVWTGTSIAAVAAVGVVFFDEPTTLIRLGSIGLIVLGIIGLRLES